MTSSKSDDVELERLRLPVHCGSPVIRINVQAAVVSGTRCSVKLPGRLKSNHPDTQTEADWLDVLM